MRDVQRRVPVSEAAGDGDPPRLVIVGQLGGTNVGASLQRAAMRSCVAATFVDASLPASVPRWLRIASWRLAGHRPAHLATLSQQVVATCRQMRPRWLLTTGLVPVNARALAAVGRLGVRRLNYLTDDPWNPGLRSAWFLAALREYDHVFSVRRSNLADLARHGCAHVSYLPFGFDADLFFPEPPSDSERPRYAADVVFVGGADRDRVPYIAALGRAGFDVALYGDYWSRYPATRAHDRGYADPTTLRKATSAARVALCLVRRANRDGQVMRSYEAAAIGACMLVEDTPEHRELFGPDGEAVTYFGTLDQMLDRLRRLLACPADRRRLAAAVRQRILAGGHTYADRLRAMLREAA